MKNRSIVYASDVAVCDLDPCARTKVDGGIPTNNQRAIQGLILSATPIDPVTLIVDRHFATSTLVLPASGYVTIRGEIPGARIMAVPGTNGACFRSTNAPQRPYDPGSNIWNIIGIGDFDGDGIQDLAWRRADDTGGVIVWLMSASGTVKRILGIPEAEANWKVVGIGDFDGDGHLDLAWRRADHAGNQTGEVRIWLLDPTGAVRRDFGLPLPAPDWKVIGVADFDGDGCADIAWRRADGTGEVRIWLINPDGTTRMDYGLPPPDPDWSVIGIGDFDGDGRADLLWRRTNDTGEARIWLLNGSVKKKDIGLPPPDADWKVIGVGDFDGDGRADLLWRRKDGTGEARVWLIDAVGGVMVDYGLPPTADGWKVIGVGDFDGDGRADIAWRRTNDSGETRIWTLNGATILCDQGLPLLATGGHVRFESLVIDGFRNNAGYPLNSNVSKVSSGAERWSAKGRVDGDGPWFNGLDLAYLDVVELKDVHIFDAPTYGARFNCCRRVSIQGGGVTSPLRTAIDSADRNTDGYHFDGGCSDVTISDVTMATGDDAIAINTSEGVGLESARFVISNVVFDDCNTGVRVYGPTVPTRQVTISNVAGTVQFGLLIYGVEDKYLNATVVPGTNHSVTISHADVKVAHPAGAVVQCFSTGGSLSLNDVKQTEPEHETPFMLFGVDIDDHDPDQKWWDFCVSDVALSDCAIYRSSTGSGAAYILKMNHGRIGTLTLNNFRVTEEVGSTGSLIDYLLFIRAPGSVDTLIVEGGHYAGVKLLNDPDRIAHFGGTGLVATGLWIPAAKTLPGARFLNADDRGRLYENIGGGVFVDLTATTIELPNPALPPYRTQLWSESFAESSLPANWSSSGAGTWTVSGALLSPSGSVGYGEYVTFARAFGLDRRTNRIRFQIETAATVLGFAGIQATTGLGSGQGLITVNSITNTLTINGGWSPGSTPGVAFSAPLGFSMSVGHDYLLSLEFNHCAMTVCLTDAISGITASLICGDNTAPPDASSFPESFFCDYIAFVNIAGQFKIHNFTVLGVSPSLPRPRVMFLGDSITFGVGLAEQDRWTTIVGQNVPERSYVVSGRPGDRSLGALARAMAELQFMRPAYLVLLIGTNDSDDAMLQVNVSAISAAAESSGTSVILCCLPTNGRVARTAFNHYVLTRGLPVVRFDLATSVGNDGSTQDTSLFASDKTHPNSAGAAAMAARFRIDAPQIFD